jgi:ribosomal protein L10
MIGSDPDGVSEAAGRERGKIPSKQEHVSMLFQRIESQHLGFLQFAPGADAAYHRLHPYILR